MSVHYKSLQKGSHRAHGFENANIHCRSSSISATMAHVFEGLRSIRGGSMEEMQS